MIRDATLDDIPALLGMAERFITKAWLEKGIPYSEAECTAFLAGLIEADGGILLISEARDAMLGALIFPWYFNKAILTGQELFWWTEPGSKAGLALLDAIEARAASMGAKSFQMASVDSLRSPALARLYRARGYAPSEHIYMKRF